MERINQITIANYRAFYNEQGQENKYQINLPKGENLLVYGENGSGKSSLFKAMQDFFHSTKEEIIPQENVFTQNVIDLPETTIRVRFTDNTIFELNRLSSTAFDHDFFKNAKSAFLTYRDVLNTYFLDLNNGKNNPNLFDLFINEILYCLSDTEEISEILRDIENLRSQVNTFDKVYKREIRGITDRGQQLEIFQGLKERINSNKKDINEKLTNLLNRLLRIVNNYLKKYFNFNFQVNLQNKNGIIYTRISKESQIIKESLYLKIKLYGSEINQHTYQSFLNEARLSALALSVYLAALKIESGRLPNQNHKFLFLDDIFIGLDTSNRIPLLEIIKKDFKDFQIIITTYDRHWFEVAKNWLQRRSSTHWKSFELYTDDYTYTDKEVPKLLPYKDALAQALAYYKQSDYSASGNYLRRTCEEVLNKILPSICLKDSNGIDFTKLSQMLESALYFFKMVNKPTNEIDLLAVYLQSLMNPLSHYDFDISVYRKELKDVEQALNNLLKIDLTRYSFRLILPQNSIVKLTYQVAAATMNVYEIKIREDLWIYKENGNPQIHLSTVECKNESLYEIKNGIKGQEFHHPIVKDSLRVFYEEVVNTENQGNPILNIQILPNYEALYEYQKEDKTWDRLQNLLRF